MDTSGEPSRGEVSRERILQASAELFARQGYHGTSLSEILAACGLSKGGFYHHFTSKEELFAATVERFLSNRGEAGPSAPDARAETAVPSTEARLRELFRPLPERTAGYHSMLFEAIRASDEVRDRIRALYREHVERCEALLREGQAGGEVRAHLDCARWATHMMCTLEGASFLAALSGGELSEESVDRLFTSLWRAVRRLEL